MQLPIIEASESATQPLQPVNALNVGHPMQVMRVAMLALRNLLTNDKLQLGPEMVEAGLPKVVQQRITQVCCTSSCSRQSSSHAGVCVRS